MLRNLFRRRSPEELRREADALFAEGRYGDAKLAYDRVAERADASLASEAEARAASCCDHIARARGEEARRLFAAGERELAEEELRHALEVARSDELRKELAELEERTVSPRQRRAAPEPPPPPPLSDEERLMLITGSWEPAQARELERYGEPLLEALLALERGAIDAGRSALSAIAGGAPEATYLQFELARAALLGKDEPGAEAALRTFLARLGAEGGGTPRLLASRELARLSHQRGEPDAALALLEATAEALSDDPRAYLELGNYLRAIGRPVEAIEVLELCEGMYPAGRVEWPVALELGLARAAAGDTTGAIARLEELVRQALASGERELPEPAALPLAELHERAGNLTRAADLYRSLAEHAEGEHVPHYLREAARLLTVLGLTEEAERLAQRAALLGGAADRRERAASESTAERARPKVGE